MNARVISGVLAVLSAVLIGMVSQQAQAAENTPLMERVGLGSERGECVAVDVGEDAAISEVERQWLFDAQMVGVPGDGHEALYSVDCFGSDGSLSPYVAYISMVVVGPEEPTPLNEVTEGSALQDYSADTQDAILNSPCFDVISSTPDVRDARIEFNAPDVCNGGEEPTPVSTDLTVVGQVEIPTQQGDTVVTEYDGPTINVIYADDSVESIPTPLTSDHMANMVESLEKGCKAKDMYEDYSCKGPSYTGYTPKGSQSVSKPSASSSGSQVPGMEHADAVKAESARLLAATTQYAPKTKSK